MAPRACSQATSSRRARPGLAQVGPGQDADRAHAPHRRVQHARPGPPSRRAAPPRRRCRKNSRLPSAPGIGRRAGPAHRVAQSAGPRRPPRAGRAGAARGPSRSRRGPPAGVPPRTAASPAPPRRPPGPAPRSAGRILSTEMNDTSMVASVQGSGTSAGESVRAFVALADHHARVGAQPLVELAAAHVHRVDARGPAREQHLREAAGGGAHVHGHAARGVEAEARRGRPRASARPGPRGRGRAATTTDEASADRACPACWAGAPSTRTRPAMTRACAFSRDSARPCSTSQTSRRVTGARSRAPVHDEAGQVGQQRSPLADRGATAARASAQQVARPCSRAPRGRGR